jgi:hypothetical protein
MAILDDSNDLHAAIADFRAMKELNLVSPRARPRVCVRRVVETDAQAGGDWVRDHIVVDGNVSAAAFDQLHDHLTRSERPENQIVWFEPTSVFKSSTALRAAGQARSLVMCWREPTVDHARRWQVQVTDHSHFTRFGGTVRSACDFVQRRTYHQ